MGLAYNKSYDQYRKQSNHIYADSEDIYLYKQHKVLWRKFWTHDQDLKLTGWLWSHTEQNVRPVHVSDIKPKSVQVFKSPLSLGTIK